MQQCKQDRQGPTLRESPQQSLGCECGRQMAKAATTQPKAGAPEAQDLRDIRGQTPHASRLSFISGSNTDLWKALSRNTVRCDSRL